MSPPNRNSLNPFAWLRSSLTEQLANQRTRVQQQIVCCALTSLELHNKLAGIQAQQAYLLTKDEKDE